MKSDLSKWSLTFIFFVVLACIIFRGVFPEHMVFSASDLNIGRLAEKKYALPELLTGCFSANQVMGSSGYEFSLFNILLAIFPLTFFANFIYPLILVTGSLAMVWFLRIWERCWIASIIGAIISFWFNSILLASAGHAYKMEVLALSVLSLAFIEKNIRTKSIRGAFGYSLLAGITMGFMMIEQQDVALLAILFIGSYMLFRLFGRFPKMWKRWMILLLPVAIVSLSLSSHTLLNSYKNNISDVKSIQNTSTEKWNYVTQWSLVPSEWPDLIAPGWSGWRSNHPDFPYWGKIGQSPDFKERKEGFYNFKLDSIYIGILPFIFSILAIILSRYYCNTEDKKHILFWSFASILALFIACGKYSLIYKGFYQLPLVSNIRAPIKLLDNMQIGLGILSAFGLHALINNKLSIKSIHRIIKGNFLIAFIFILASVCTFLFSDFWSNYFDKIEFSDFSDALISRMSLSWLHAGIIALLGSAAIFSIYKQKVLLAGGILILTFSIDSILLTNKYFKADNISSIKNSNSIISYLKENQDSEKIVFLDQTGIYNQWLAQDGPYHKLNIFNIWQMPRMPKDYSEYLKIIETNPIKLWQLSAVKYICMPHSIFNQLDEDLKKDFEIIQTYHVPTSQSMRQDVLIKFKSYIPRMSLYQNWKSVILEDHCKILSLQEYNPFQSTLVFSKNLIPDKSDGLSMQPLQCSLNKRSIMVEVNIERDSIVRFSQRYNPEWTVFIDGKEAELLRIDFLSMGVFVPAGEHKVVFRCPSGNIQMIFYICILFVSLCTILICFRKKK